MKKIYLLGIVVCTIILGGCFVSCSSDDDDLNTQPQVEGPTNGTLDTDLFGRWYSENVVEGHSYTTHLQFNEDGTCWQWETTDGVLNNGEAWEYLWVTEDEELYLNGEWFCHYLTVAYILRLWMDWSDEVGDYTSSEVYYKEDI